MAVHRWGRDRPAKTTVGDVFVALGRDEWTRGMLAEIYRKLFEGEGVRQGTSPDHFIYVSPGRARSEISQVSAWIGSRFGEPGGTVPARTPFGYLSGRYDGWVTLFSALRHGGDESLARDFSDVVAGMSWSSAQNISRVGGEQSVPVSSASPSAPPVAGPTFTPATIASSASSGGSWGFLTKPYAARQSASAARTSPMVERWRSSSSAPSSTFVERFMGAQPSTISADVDEYENEEAERAYKENLERLAIAELLKKEQVGEKPYVFNTWRGKRTSGEGLLGGQVGSGETRVGAIGDPEDLEERARLKTALAEQHRAKMAAIRAGRRPEPENDVDTAAGRRALAERLAAEREQALAENLAPTDEEKTAEVVAELKKKSTVEELARPKPAGFDF